MRYLHHQHREETPNSVPAARGSEAGFTLMELVVVAALIGTLSAISIPRLSKYADEGRGNQATNDITDIAAAIDQYVMDNGEYPDSLDDVGKGGLVDPWGNPYEYLNLSCLTDGKCNPKPRKDHFLIPINSDYDLYSMGPDGRTGSPLTDSKSRDDIIRASNGAFFGPVTEF